MTTFPSASAISLFSEFDPTLECKKINAVAISPVKRLTDLKGNRRYSVLLTAIFMTLALDTTMTFTMTTIMTGWNLGFPQRFVYGWIIGFLVGLPTSLVVTPFVRKLVNKLLFEQNSPEPKVRA